jgi:hypothetical protein
MAAGRHNLTRRALLGAGAALPVALAARAAAPSRPFPPFGPGPDPGASKPATSFPPSRRNAPFDAACGGAQDRLRQAQGEREDGESVRGPARWERALAAYAGAARALESFCRDRLRPALDAHQAIRARWPLDHDFRADAEARALLEPAFAVIGPLEDRADDLECARLDALRRLLRLPAPDLAALALKIELAVDNEAWELTGAETCLAALKADARRLCRGS